jgi:acyl-CoA synthetase (NDP forming)
MAAPGLARLLRPASVAIVGASDKVGPGYNAWRALEHVGFEGRVYLVNPNRAELLGRRTYPSLDAIPESIDAVFIAVNRGAALDAVRQAAAMGAGGVALLSSGFAEAGPEGVQAQRELVDIARTHGMAVCGPNCLGFLNFTGRTALFGTSLPAEVPRGGVAAVVQSGSVGIALLNSGRDLGLACLITSGNEAVTTAADYLDALVDDPGVAVVIAFLEQLRRPDLFVTACRRARAADKPVIVVKTGRTERGRQAVMAHTGALAGSDEVCDAAFRAAGAIRVATLDELLETATLLAAVRRRPAARGVALLSPSGGEIALALDVADGAGLELPPVEGARPALAALLPDFAHVGNPLDLTWAGLYDPTVARRCAEALGAQPEVGMLVLLQDAPRGLGEQQAARYAALLRAVADGAAAVTTPLAVVSNLAGELHPVFEDVARAARVPCLRGTQEGLLAVARLVRWALDRPDAPASAGADGAAAAARAALAALPPHRAPAEHEARQVLAPYGLTGPREHLVTTAAAAAAAARRLGFPVVLKALAEEVLHKTDAGLVRVGARSEEEVHDAAARLLARAAEMGRPVLGLLVQEMVRPVAELIVGGRVDPAFGPVVLVGGGGVTVELYRDVAIRLAPVSEAEAHAMLRETRAAALLAGWRGRPRGDVEALARAVVGVSRLVSDLRAEISEVEINPLAVLPEGRGVTALDALVVRPARHASPM